MELFKNFKIESSTKISALRAFKINELINSANGLELTQTASKTFDWFESTLLYNVNTSANEKSPV